jgi:hypothetical protein
MTTPITPDNFGPWALVTGASSGIGSEFAAQLAGRGFNLVLAARRVEKLEALGRDLTAQHGIEVRTVGVDLSRPDFLDTVRETTDGVDLGLVVSNAGAGEFGALLDLDLDRLESNLQLNVHAHLQISHHFGRQLAHRGRGGIVLVSSTGAMQGVPYLANYSASKAYVVALGEALNYELAQQGVSLSVLLPGPTDTPMLHSIEAFDPDNMPMKPMSTEQTVKEGLDALARNRATHIAGRLNRIMATFVPRSRAPALWGGMMEKSMKQQPALGPDPRLNGSW